MAFTREELERMIDDTRDRGVIIGEVYCGNCGYNLKTLPYVYRCPECGNEYNARPLTMRGIFLPSQASIPLWEIATSVVFTVGAVLIGRMAFLGSNTNPFFVILLVITFMLILFAARFAWGAVCALSQGRRGRAVARRIAQNEYESTERRGSPT